MLASLISAMLEHDPKIEDSNLARLLYGCG